MAEALKIFTTKKKKDLETLRTVSEEVKKEEFGDPSFNKFLDNLLESAIQSKIPACGISSPQVGVNKRIFYINNYDTKKWELFINPIVEPVNFTKVESDEACLSIPNCEGRVSRYKRVKVKFQDRKGIWYIKKYDDYNAITIQHENDHLDGILFTDRVEK